MCLMGYMRPFQTNGGVALLGAGAAKLREDGNNFSLGERDWMRHGPSFLWNKHAKDELSQL